MIIDLHNNKKISHLIDNKSILITGANGLIGSGVVDALMLLNTKYKSNIQVFALCRNKEKAKKRFDSYLNSSFFHILHQDVCETLNTNVEFDFIFHLASGAGPHAFNSTPVEVMKSNFCGTLNLLNYTRNKKTRLIFVSSSEIYGENLEDFDIFEESTLGTVDYNVFRSCYSESKRAAETLCHSFVKEYNSDVVIARPAFIYGKNINEDNSRADVYFLKQIMKHENIVMYSDGSQIRSYCHINDCISALFFIALKGECNQAYNISNNNCVVSLREYVQKLCDIGGVNLIIDYSKKPKDTVLLKTTKMILDTHKLEQLGWFPTTSLEQGIEEILF